MKHLLLTLLLCTLATTAQATVTCTRVGTSVVCNDTAGGSTTCTRTGNTVTCN